MLQVCGDFSYLYKKDQLPIQERPVSAMYKWKINKGNENRQQIN